MIVDLPHPDGPTNAVVFPASNTPEKLSRIVKSALDGYLKDTFLNSIRPSSWSLVITCEPGSLGLI